MKKFSFGFSLIETLVVIAIFSVVAIVVSQATTASLSGGKKSDAAATVREELGNALSVIERHIRSAKSINPLDCTGLPIDTIRYTDQNGGSASFVCSDSATCSSSTNSYIASGSARLTSQRAICITNCQFVCTPSPSNLPPTVSILLQGQSKETSGTEDSIVEVKTSVTLRAY